MYLVLPTTSPLVRECPWPSVPKVDGVPFNECHGMIGSFIMKFIVEARSVLPLFLPPADERKILACATSFLLTFTSSLHY